MTQPRKGIGGGLETVDTIFDHFMRPVYANEPDAVRNLLMRPHPERWVKVCIGKTQDIVSIPEYLYQDKYQTTVEVLLDLLEKADKPIYRRDPERLKTHVERTARRLIERIMDK